jgi:hypothetical protein
MKLNQKQPYGHVYGNHVAAFTQNGKFFDGAGNEVDDDGVMVDPPEADLAETEAAAEFLKQLLDGTQVSKKKVADAAEAEGISWHLVENAANELDVVKFKKGVVWFWRLNEEN